MVDRYVANLASVGRVAEGMDGTFVLASDYDALAARLAEAEQQRDRAIAAVAREGRHARRIEIERLRVRLMDLEERRAHWQQMYQQLYERYAVDGARLAEAERRAEIFARYCNPAEMLPEHADMWANSLQPTDNASAILFRHWSKDPLVPYAGCECSTCAAVNGTAS